MRKARRGHPDVFTREQNKALREAMRALQERRHYSQTALGNIIGVSQQTAGNLLNDDDAGFSYVPATKLVRLCGFAGVDSFFRAKGVELPRASEPPPKRTGTDG